MGKLNPLGGTDFTDTDMVKVATHTGDPRNGDFQVYKVGAIRVSQHPEHFEFQHPLMAPCRTLVVPWCVGMFLRLRIGLGVRRTWRKLEKTCSTFKLQCRKGDTIQDLWELEFFISCAFLGIRIPSSMWEQRCGNRQGSTAAVYSRYNKN